MLELLLLVLLPIAVMAIVYIIDKKVDLSTPRHKRPYLLTYCAWCIHRAGDHCTHPDSPVYNQPCGPVCIGARRCSVRDFKR